MVMVVTAMSCKCLARPPEAEEGGWRWTEALLLRRAVGDGWKGLQKHSPLSLCILQLLRLLQRSRPRLHLLVSMPQPPR